MAKGMKMWKGNGNISSLLISPKVLKILYQVRREQVKNHNDITLQQNTSWTTAKLGLGIGTVLLGERGDVDQQLIWPLIVINYSVGIIYICGNEGTVAYGVLASSELPGFLWLVTGRSINEVGNYNPAYEILLRRYIYEVWHKSNETSMSSPSK